MGKKLLIVNTYANLWSTGRIAAEIGEIAVKHGWQRAAPSPSRLPNWWPTASLAMWALASSALWLPFTSQR